MNQSVVASRTQKLLFIVLKYVVLLLTVISFSGVVWSGIKIATSFGNTFEAPEYGKQNDSSRKNDDEQIDTGAEAKLALTTKYGDSIMKLLGAHSLDKNLYYDQIFASVLGLPKDVQGKYVSSAENWMDVSMKAGKDAQLSIMEFDGAFHQAVYSDVAQKNQAKAARNQWISVATTGGMILVALVLALVLIQIEANTRLAVESLSGEGRDRKQFNEQPVKTIQAKVQDMPSGCPQCGASITESEMFCEGCGHKLK